MPELPEVHTVIEDLRAAGLVGMRIRGTVVSWERTVGGDVDVFSSRVTGRRIAALSRRGKYIRADLSGGVSLLVHLRMSGRLFLEEKTAPLSGYERVRLLLEEDHPRVRNDRELRFHDPRKFGRMVATADPGTILDALGIEPLSSAFDEAYLATLLVGRRRIKPLLLDQTVIAGLGNIYVDEALWHARIHPLTPASSLERSEIAALAAAVPLVLRRGIRNLGTSLGSGKSNFYLPNRATQARNQEELAVFRRTGLPCPRCGTAIERLIVAQRSSHVCPSCQLAPD